MYPLNLAASLGAKLSEDTGYSDAYLVVMVFVCLVLLVALLIWNNRLSRRTEMLKKSESAFRISEEQYRVAMRHSQLHVFRLDVNNSTAYVDENLCVKYMLPEELTCVPDSLILCGMIPRQSVDAFTEFFNMMSRGEPTGECIIMIKDPDKPMQEVWYRFEYTLVENETSRFAVIIYDDYTEKREKLIANKKLERELEMLDLKQVQVLEYNLTKDVCVSVRGVLLDMDMCLDVPLNKRTEDWTKHYVLREDMAEYASFLNRDRLLTAFGDGIREQTLDFKAYSKQNEDYRWMRLNVQMQPYPGSDDIMLYAVYRDVHESKVEEITLRTLSEEDPLTGIYNRLTFEKTVRAIVESSDHCCHALLMIDMDGFKNVNDTFGHVMGDNVLVNSAQSVKNLLRSGDVVGRIGGDEFMVLLRDIPGEEVVRKRAELINEILRSRISEEVAVSASIGVAIFPKDGSTFESLYYSADMAVYYAKRHGRDRFYFFNDEMKDDDSLITHTPIEKLSGDRDMDEVRKKHVEQILMKNEMLTAKQEEDERYRAIIDRLGMATFEWNTINKKFVFSDTFGQFVISKQDGAVLFNNVFDGHGVYPDDRETFRKLFIPDSDNSENVREIKARLMLKNGEYAWCHIVAIIISDEMKGLTRVIGVISKESSPLSLVRGKIGDQKHKRAGFARV